MLTEGEWEALDWYFKFYNKISVMSTEFDLSKKHIRKKYKLRDKILIATDWFMYQLLCPILLMSIAVLLQQKDSITLLQIIGVGLNSVAFIFTFVPSYFLSFSPYQPQIMINNVIFIESRITAKLVIDLNAVIIRVSSNRFYITDKLWISYSEI